MTKRTKVTKSTADLYSVRHGTGEGWADIFLLTGDTSVSVVIESDYGNYSYSTGSTGGDPIQFLIELGFSYIMGKMFGDKIDEPDTDKYKDSIKESIIESRKNEALTREEARDAWHDMLGYLEEYREGVILKHYLCEHEHFESVFGEYEYCLPETKTSDRAIDLWNDVWVPFVDQLKKETV